jgi:hypothetical protein
LFLLLNACGAADPASPTEGVEANVPVADYGQGVVVATLKPSEGQTILVVEYPEGVMGIGEWQGPGFDPATPTAMANFRGGSMAEFYERVAGEALDVKVLDKLVVTAEGAKAAMLEERAALGTRVEDTVLDAPALPTEAIAAPGLPAATELDTPAIQARAGLACAQDGDYYNHYASGWAGANCKNPPGWEDAWCRVDDPEIEKGWTHGERWMIQIQNMSLCNKANIFAKLWKDTWRGSAEQPLLQNVEVGPNGGGMWWWEIASRDWRMYTKFTHKSGNEYPHLNLAHYRQW